MKLSILHVTIWMLLCVVHLSAQKELSANQRHLDLQVTEEIRDKYLFVGNFHYNRARFHSKECKWGYLDENFKEVIPAQFDWAEDFDRQLAEVEIKRGHALINPQGQRVTPLCGYLHVEMTDHFYKVTCHKPNKAGLISKRTLQPIGDFEMKDIYDLKNGFFEYQVGFRSGILDSLGNRVTAAAYEEMSYRAPGNKVLPYFAVMQRKKWGVIDAKGEVIVPLEHADARVLAPEGLFGLQDRQGGRWGIMNRAGNWVIEPKLDYPQLADALFGPNFFVYQDDLGYHLYNHQGEELGQYADGSHFYVLPNGAWVMDAGGYRYLLDQNGKPASNAYFDINHFSQNWLEITLENKVGICDLEGKELIAPQYEDIRLLKKGHIRLKLDKEYYYWNENMEIPAGPFDMIFVAGDQHLLFKKDSNYSIQPIGNAHSPLIDSFPYQAFELFKYKNNFTLKKEGKWGIFNTKSNRYIDLQADTIVAIEQYVENNLNVGEQLAYLKSEKWNILDSNYQFIQQFTHRPYASYQLNGEDYYAYSISEDRDSMLLGVMRAKDGRMIVPPKYQRIQLMPRQYFLLRVWENYSINYVDGLVDLEGNTILPVAYRDIMVEEEEVITAYSTDSHEKQYFLPDGAPVPIDGEYEVGYQGFENGLAIVKDQDYNSGAINLLGQVIIPFEYDNIHLLDAGVWEARKGLNRYLFDSKGNWIHCYRRKPLPLTRFFDSW